MKRYTKDQIKQMLYPIQAKQYPLSLDKKTGKMSDDAEEEIQNLLENSMHYAVIYDYCSDGPGYVGDMLFVVWGDASIYDVYKIKNGVLVPEPRCGCCRAHCASYEHYDEKNEN